MDKGIRDFFKKYGDGLDLWAHSSSMPHEARIVFCWIVDISYGWGPDDGNWDDECYKNIPDWVKELHREMNDGG